MKKSTLLIFSLCLFTVITVSAQINKGAIFLGGNLNAISQNAKSDGVTAYRQNGISFSPVFGKATRQNLVVGVDANFSFTKSNFPNSIPDAQNQKIYGLGVFARKYKPLGNNFYVFGQGRFGLDYALLSASYVPQQQESKTKRYGANIVVYPGLAYAMSKRFQLETGLTNLLVVGYYNETTRNTGGISEKTVVNSFNISSSLSSSNSWLYVGFRILLNKV